MRMQLIGASHEVTGSCTLLEVSGKHDLVDCGMEQGKDVFQNIDLPVAGGAHLRRISMGSHPVSNCHSKIKAHPVGWTFILRKND